MVNFSSFCLALQNLPNDIHIIAVDLPGHGDSDAPTDDYDISHFNTVTKMHKVWLFRASDK